MPNPQSPIPNPQSPYLNNFLYLNYLMMKLNNKKIINIKAKNNNIK